MLTSSGTTVVATSVVLIDTAASIDAFRSGQVSIGVITSVAAAGAAAIVVAGRGRPIRVRSDLASWAARTAAATGRTSSDIVDRALSEHRHRLDDSAPGRDR